MFFLFSVTSPQVIEITIEIFCLIVRDFRGREGWHRFFRITDPINEPVQTVELVRGDDRHFRLQYIGPVRVTPGTMCEEYVFSRPVFRRCLGCTTSEDNVAAEIAQSNGSKACCCVNHQYTCTDDGLFPGDQDPDKKKYEEQESKRNFEAEWREPNSPVKMLPIHDSCNDRRKNEEKSDEESISCRPKKDLFPENQARNAQNERTDSEPDRHIDLCGVHWMGIPQYIVQEIIEGIEHLYSSLQWIPRVTFS
jgi:hypothetical protein